ncbi:hypothetical protein HMSSN036_24010 [Paenibacillus macerans]|nr:hypothetical protein HMSSN036_24010 [Paenibacillus macerans]
MKVKVSIVTLVLIIFASSFGNFAMAESPTWKTSGEMPFYKGRPASGVINNQLYVAGGIDNTGTYTNTVFHYNPTTEAWTKTAPMNQGRELTAYGVVGEKLYVAGGVYQNSGQNQTDALEVFDPQANTWSNLTKMTAPRFGASGASLNNLFYVIGGASLDNKYSNKVESYDTKANKWNTETSLPEARLYGSAITFKNEILLFLAV